MSSDTPSPESVDDIKVRLKPVFGVEPKIYLAVIYSLALVALLFALLVLPGMTNPGTRVTVTSVPSGAAIVSGDKHWGTTPATVYLPQGTAKLTVSKPGFAPDTRDYTSGNQWFASLFFPKTDAVAVTLKATSDTSVADLARTEIGRWALAVPFTSDYRFPPLFTRFAEDARAAGWDADRVKAFLLGLRGAVADPQMYADYGRALGLWTNDVPEGLEAQFTLWKPLVGEDGRLALWLLANQTKPVRDREITDPSDWFQARLAEVQKPLAASKALGAAPSALAAGGVTYRGVPETALLWGSESTAFTLPTEPPFVVPVPMTVEAFWIADREVTQAQFAAFDLNHAVTQPDAPVTQVTWVQAQAYVAWLNASGKVPAGKKAVLPDDAQWEAAARTPGLSLLNQGVWEWTASAWYPAQSLVTTERSSLVDNAAYAHSLKGGVQSAKGSVKASDRAGWPSNDATTELGFRVALVNQP